MKDLEKLVEQIKKEQTIYLSSDFTKGGAIIGVIFVVGASFFIVPKLFDTSEGFQFNILIASALLLVLGAFAVFQLMYAAEAKLRGKKLILNKVIGKNYEVDVSQIEKISSFKSRSTKYTYLKFKGMDGNPEKALIFNSNSILFGKETSAGDVIKLAQQV